MYSDMNWKEHPSGILVSDKGVCFIPQSHNNPAHYTKGYKMKEGYMRVGFKGVYYKVHRLVCECFIPNTNPSEYDTVDHINRVRDDNRVENLRWANDSIQNKNKGYTNNLPVLQYTKAGEFVAEYESIQDAKNKTGINSGGIWNVCNGKKGQKTSGGFMWKYK